MVTENGQVIFVFGGIWNGVDRFLLSESGLVVCGGCLRDVLRWVA